METDPQNKRKALLWLILAVQHIHVHICLFPFHSHAWVRNGTEMIRHILLNMQRNKFHQGLTQPPGVWRVHRMPPEKHRARNSHRAKAGTCSPLEISTAKDLSQRWSPHTAQRKRHGLEHGLEHLSGGASSSCCSREPMSLLSGKIQLLTVSFHPFGKRSCNIFLDTVTVNLPSDVASWNLGSNKSVPEGLGSCPCRPQVPGTGQLSGGAAGAQGQINSDATSSTMSCHTWRAPLSLKAPWNSKTRVCSITLQLYASTSLGWTITPS